MMLFGFVLLFQDKGYVPSTYPLKDLTLLKLEHPAMINNVTRPVCLPTATSRDEVIKLGTAAECYVVGFGATEKLFSGRLFNLWSFSNVYPYFS